MEKYSNVIKHHDKIMKTVFENERVRAAVSFSS